MTIFPENHIREEMHRKVPEKSVSSVPDVPDDAKDGGDAGGHKDPWDEFLEDIEGKPDE